MVNQICIIGVLMGLSEGLLLAEATNLNIEKVVDTLDKGAAGSWQMHHRLLSMSKNEFDFGFAIKWMQKDLRICLEEANKHGLNLLLTEDARKRYLDLIDQGLEGKEASSLICSIRQTASNYN